MKIFHCDHCQQLVFFENVHCLSCDHALAYVPDSRTSFARAGRRRALASPRQARRRATYRLCANYDRENVCNWAVAAEDPDPLCGSCRLTRVIPDLGAAGQQGGVVPARGREAAAGLQPADARPAGREQDRRPRARRRVRVPRRGDRPAPRVLTGHSDGVITINVAEADDAEREQRRKRAARALPHAARPLPPRDRPLLLGAADRRRRAARDASARCSATSAPTTRTALQQHYDERRAGGLAGAVHQRLRQRASVGGLGGDVGALSAHDRHARDRGGLRAVAPAAPRRRAGARRRRPRPRARAVRPEDRRPGSR